MRWWPRRGEWTQHLARWNDGRSSLGETGVHGGAVTTRGFERTPCHTCGAVGTWTSPGPEAMYGPPTGHRLVQEDGMLLDICPLA